MITNHKLKSILYHSSRFGFNCVQFDPAYCHAQGGRVVVRKIVGSFAFENGINDSSVGTLNRTLK